MYSNQNFENQLVQAASRLSQHNLQNFYSKTGVQYFRQPTATGTQQFLNPILAHMNESEQNVSIYDEGNGSYIDEMGFPEAG